jgi:hypothetical protein
MILAHEYILLALDEETGKFAFTISGYCDYGVAGAVLGDLYLSNYIQIEGGKVIPQTKTPPKNEILEKAFHLISREPNSRSLDYWIMMFMTIFKEEARKILITNMENEGILGREEIVYQKIYKKVRHPLKNPELKANLLRKIEDTLMMDLIEDIDPSTRLLIGLIDATELDRSLFEKEFRTAIKEKMKKIMQSDPIASSIKNRIDVNAKEAMTLINSAFT